MKDLKTKFLQVYANLPLGSRKEIVAVISGEPITWQAAKLEIELETIKGREILDQLAELKILTNE